MFLTAACGSSHEEAVARLAISAVNTYDFSGTHANISGGGADVANAFSCAGKNISFDQQFSLAIVGFGSNVEYTLTLAGNASVDGLTSSDSIDCTIHALQNFEPVEKRLMGNPELLDCEAGKYYGCKVNGHDLDCVALRKYLREVQCGSG